MMGGRNRRAVRRDRLTPRWLRRPLVYTMAVAIVAGLALSLFILQSLKIRALRNELVVLQEAEQQARLEQGTLRARLAEADELAAIEAAAREQLGWVLRGEEKAVFIGEEE